MAETAPRCRGKKNHTICVVASPGPQLRPLLCQLSGAAAGFPVLKEMSKQIDGQMIEPFGHLVMKVVVGRDNSYKNS